MDAKRGDLVVIEHRSSYTYTDHTEHRTNFTVGMVTSITRDRMVKRYREIGYNTEQELSRRVGLVRWYIVPASTIDVEAAEAAVKAHHYDGHPNQVRPFDSIEEVKAALAPHKLVSA